MSAQVVARINPFKEALTKLSVDAGTKVSEVLKQLKILSIFHALCYVNGNPVDLAYELQSDDLLNVCAVPGINNYFPQPNAPAYYQPQQPPKNLGRSLLGGAIGIGGLSAAYLLSRFSGQRTADSNATKNASGLSGYVAPPESIPVLPAITGISNQLQRGSKIPYIAGKYLMRPSHSSMPWTLIEGQDQYINLAFDVGLGPNIYTNHQIGDKSTATMPEITNIEVAQTLTIFPYDYEELPIGEAVTFAAPITKLAPQLADQLTIVLSFDNGLYHAVTSTNAQGQQVTKFNTASVNVKIEYRNTAGGSFVTLASGPVGTNSQKTYRFPWSVNISRAALYEVRVTRLDADSVDPTIVNAFSWTFLRATRFESPVKTSYDSQGVVVPAMQVGLRIKASNNVNGNLDDYNVTVSHQVSKWNGSTWGAAVESSNPAWIFVDMLTGPFFDSRVLKSDLDPDAFKAWADYCDAQGYSFNYIFDQPTTLSDALKMVAAAGRASFCIRDGKYTPIVDKPQTIIAQHFSPANSWDYTISRAWPRKAEAIEATFANKDLKYEEDTRLVYWDGFSAASTKCYIQKLSLPGIVDANLVYKFCRWLMRTMRLRPVTHEITTDLQQICCNVGDLVRLTHDVPRLGIGEGYIKTVNTDGSGNITSVVLDQSVILTAGNVYGLRVRCSDGSSFFRQIVTTAGEQTTVSFTIPIPSATSPKPQVNDHFQCGLYDNDSAPMIVVSIQHQADLCARITMLDYSPDIYAKETEVVPAYNPNTTERSLSRFVVPKPTFIGIQTNEAVLAKLPDDSLISQILITMEPPKDYRVNAWESQYKRTDEANYGPISHVPIGPGYILISNVEDGIDYNIQVRAFIPPGAESEWTDLPVTTVIGKQTPPPKPLGLVYLAERNRIRALLPPMPLDYAGLRWKAAIGDVRQWDLITTVVNLEKTGELDTSQLPTGLITIGCRTVDVAGNESSDTTWLLVDLQHWVANNIYLEQDYHPTFPGILTGGTVSSGVIQANSTGGNYWNADSDGSQFWNQADSDLFWDTGTVRCVYQFDYTPDSSLLGKDYKIVMRNDIELIVDAAAYFVEYKPVDSSLYWTDDTAPFWSRASDSDLWWVDNGVWLPWTGSLDGSSGQITFRITCYESVVHPAFIEQVSVIADVLDREERFGGLVLATSGGARPDLGGRFIAIKNIAVTPQVSAASPDARSGGYADTEVNPGPLILAYDSTGSACAGIVDVVIQGY